MVKKKGTIFAFISVAIVLVLTAAIVIPMMRQRHLDQLDQDLFAAESTRTNDIMLYLDEDEYFIFYTCNQIDDEDIRFNIYTKLYGKSFTGDPKRGEPGYDYPWKYWKTKPVFESLEVLITNYTIEPTYLLGQSMYLELTVKELIALGFPENAFPDNPKLVKRVVQWSECFFIYSSIKYNDRILGDMFDYYGHRIYPLKEGEYDTMTKSIGLSEMWEPKLLYDPNAGWLYVFYKSGRGLYMRVYC